MHFTHLLVGMSSFLAANTLPETRAADQLSFQRRLAHSQLPGIEDTCFITPAPATITRIGWLMCVERTNAGRSIGEKVNELFCCSSCSSNILLNYLLTLSLISFLASNQSNATTMSAQHIFAALQPLKAAQGMLPLHLAFRNGCDEDVVHLLLMAYPQSVDVQDRKGRTPMVLAQQSTHANRDLYIRALERGPAYYAVANAAKDGIVSSPGMYVPAMPPTMPTPTLPALTNEAYSTLASTAPRMTSGSDNDRINELEAELSKTHKTALACYPRHPPTTLTVMHCGARSVVGLQLSCVCLQNVYIHIDNT
jgi:hypothetical protein